MSYFLTIIVVMFGVSCSPETAKEGAVAEASMAEGKEKVYLTDFDLPEKIEGKKEIEVTLTGNLPSPAYKLEKIDVKVSGKTIKITPLASFNPDIVAIQMLVKFEEKFTISVEKYGVYQVRCFARDKVIEQDVEFKTGG